MSESESDSGSDFKADDNEAKDSSSEGEKEVEEKGDEDNESQGGEEEQDEENELSEDELIASGPTLLTDRGPLFGKNGKQQPDDTEPVRHSPFSLSLLMFSFCSFPLLRTRPAAKVPSSRNDLNSRRLKSI